MNEMIYGYAGKELRVNLTDGTIEKRSLNAETMRKFIGGTGYSSELLFRELPAKLGAMDDDDNKLIFATSPLSINEVPGGGSVMLCFKSPETGIWGEARCGGDFGPDMKRAGYDFIIISGRSDKPVYLEVTDKEVLLRDATGLKGLDIYEKSDYLKKNVQGGDSRHTSTMVIGVAGENMVKFASVMNEDRAAGRGGCGAVMGHKNLIGIVVNGSQKVEMVDPEGFKIASKEVMQKVITSDTREGFYGYGTVGDLPANDEDGDFPTMNWRSNSFGKGVKIHDDYYNNIYVKARGCYKGCPMSCGRMVEVKEEPFKTPLHEGAEYETMASFTAFIMNDDPALATHCGYLCNKYGIDTISCAALIAFAMECYENGIITKEDTGGVAIEWGNPEAILSCLEMIVNREYIGELLAEGVRTAAKKLGKGSEKFAIHVKGLEGPAHDPRSGKLLGITYATANRGMCHIHPLEGMAFDRGKVDWGMSSYGTRDPNTMDRWDEAGKGKDCKILQDGLILPDILSTCKFMMYAGVTLDDWASMIAPITGWDIDGKELYRIGERVNNMQRLFNVREGIGRKDDMLPDRVLSVPEFGEYADRPECVIQDFNALLDEYYEARQWDKETGHPLKEKLSELNIGGYVKNISYYNE